ncbi:sugar-binding transcriptional regulator [Gephyromycinifex aptenodytis]|uniref:sugar-binding transcriptional regulator n=1 Tax=Gephyromycinifex aptenodytis TaxID=2716227 RepID=UPI001448518D|nr:sugar-binding transcriptional regulator [Gephyromycinifex aptenodytis]
MQDRDIQALEAARLYYEDGLSQADVAERLRVARPTVSKLISHARERGFVRIEIHDPRQVGDDLGRALRERFGLAEVRIAHPQEDSVGTLREVGRQGALLLQQLVDDGALLGVTWGETMYAVARSLTPQDRRGVEIVQLKGGRSYTTTSTRDHETIELFRRAFGGYARLLPLPVIFENPAVKEIVEGDRHLADVIDLGRRTQIAIFTVGAVEPEATLFKLGYLSSQEQDILLEKAAGDLCSHFYDDFGQLALPELDARTVGIGIEDLVAKPTRILVATGRRKARALRVALRNGFATHLVTDNHTAAAVLQEPAGSVTGRA